MPPEVIKLFQYVDSNKQKLVDDLIEPVEIQSVSTDKRYRKEVKRIIHWCEQWFVKLKIKYECFATGLYTDDEGEAIRLPPVILGSLGADKHKKTLCIYSNLDVVDANPEEWDTDPWTMVEKEGKMFGRGVSRNKGPLLCWLHVIDGYYHKNVPFPINLKFIISSTHENGSMGLERFLYTQRLYFLKNIDYIVLNESSWLTASIPCITYGFCGICHFEVTCAVSGGTNLSSEDIINKVFAYLGDAENNSVLIPGFNEDVAQITPDEERLYENIMCKLDDLRKTLPPHQQEWSQSRLLMSFWRLPSIFFSETDKCKCAGDSHSAIRKFILKIVPQQTPERVNICVSQYIQNILQFLYPGKEVAVSKAKNKTSYAVRAVGSKTSDFDMTCHMASGSRPWYEDLENISYRACAKAAKQVFKDEPSMIRLCIDVEVILIMQRITGKNILCLPMANSEANVNEANENMSYRNYFEGTKMLAAYIWNLGLLVKEAEEKEIFDDHYHFHHNAVRKRSISRSSNHQDRLENDHRVLWAVQQRAKSRQKRDFILLRPSRSLPRSGRPGQGLLNDQKWQQMWYLNRGGGLDMNVIPAWKDGVTGRGIVVTILDDGLEKDHPDLIKNYDPQASYDVNSHDEDPQPRYDMIDSNRHGTRCAGEVAATANNSLCAVGVAFGASVGGVRMLDGDVTDAVEARSLSLNPQHIDIYSASWGPDDDGKTVDGPGELATRAFIEGVTKGRSGKGSIFVWASGNGGRDHDNCNCDGYTNSIWTLSISSATENGIVPWYSEMCSSTLATTYSSGSQGEKQVVTTDLHHACTSSHTGTSASAPLAAGICALALEANKDLTWRDMQHIVVRTAKPANLYNNGWTVNGVGRNVSHSFGYGLMDAEAMVKLARVWNTVPEQHKCEVSAPYGDKVIPAKSQIILQLSVKQCKGVNFLEHVQAKISLAASRRGDLQIHLTSPAGTRVTLLTARSNDVSRAGFNSWPFMSVHTWGESPNGIWQLEVHNEGRYLANLSQWNLIFHGTEEPPQATGPELQNGHNNPYNTGRDHSGSELEHNSLESDTASGQWRDLHHVREGHVDVQRTATEDITNSACVHFSDNKCLECVQNSYMHNGRCYSTCPQGSFQSSVTKSRGKKIWKSETPSLSLRSIFKRSGDDYELQMLQCISCHYSCLSCRGPNDYECLTCPGDAVLTKKNGDENYCYPLHLIPQLQASLWFYRLYVIFIIVLVIIFSFLFIISIYYICNKYNKLNCCKQSYSYGRLGEQKLDSNQPTAKDIREEIHNVIYNVSDIDSE